MFQCANALPADVSALASHGVVLLGNGGRQIALVGSAQHGCPIDIGTLPPRARATVIRSLQSEGYDMRRASPGPCVAVAPQAPFPFDATALVAIVDAFGDCMSMEAASAALQRAQQLNMPCIMTCVTNWLLSATRPRLRALSRDKVMQVAMALSGMTMHSVVMPIDANTHRYSSLCRALFGASSSTLCDNNVKLHDPDDESILFLVHFWAQQRKAELHGNAEVKWDVYLQLKYKTATIRNMTALWKDMPRYLQHYMMRFYPAPVASSAALTPVARAAELMQLAPSKFDRSNRPVTASVQNARAKQFEAMNRRPALRETKRGCLCGTRQFGVDALYCANPSANCGVSDPTTTPADVAERNFETYMAAGIEFKEAIAACAPPCAKFSVSNMGLLELNSMAGRLSRHIQTSSN